MSEEYLMTRLLSDLASVGLPVNEVDMYFRPYSTTYYGRYFPVYDDRRVKPRIFIYPYEIDRSFMEYEVVFGNAVHEFCHHIQYTDRSFVRRKGVMHNVQFWQLYNHYMCRAYRYGVVERRGDYRVATV